MTHKTLHCPPNHLGLCVELCVKALATWRISHMLVHEDGPYEILYEFRTWSGIRYAINDNGKYEAVDYGGLSPLHCLLCTSVWVAGVLSILPLKFSWLWAISGLAILVEEFVTWLGLGLGQHNGKG